MTVLNDNYFQVMTMKLKFNHTELTMLVSSIRLTKLVFYGLINL